MRFESISNVKLPRWATWVASAAGLLLFAVGMGRLIRLSTLTEALLPMVTGSIMVYVSGFEKQLCMDGEGILQTKAFWGRKNSQFTAWQCVDDARVILNKGKYVYVLLHGADKIAPFTLSRQDAEGVLELLGDKLPADKILIEK